MEGCGAVGAAGTRVPTSSSFSKNTARDCGQRLTVEQSETNESGALDTDGNLAAQRRAGRQGRLTARQHLSNGPPSPGAQETRPTPTGRSQMKAKASHMPGASSARLPDRGQRTGAKVAPGTERGEHRPNGPGRLALAG